MSLRYSEFCVFPIQLVSLYGLQTLQQADHVTLLTLGFVQVPWTWDPGQDCELQGSRHFTTIQVLSHRLWSLCHLLARYPKDRLPLSVSERVSAGIKHGGGELSDRSAQRVHDSTAEFTKLGFRVTLT